MLCIMVSLRIILSCINLIYFRKDDLPMGAHVGTIGIENRDGKDIEHYYLFTHLHFEIYYNDKGHIIHANCTTDYNYVVELSDTDAQVEFSYSASWIRVNKSWKSRGNFVGFWRSSNGRSLCVIRKIRRSRR